MDERQVFISYAHADEAFVARLYGDLEQAGVPAVYDKMLLEIGDSIIEKLSKVVNASACVIGVISPASINSKWVQKELSWAMMRELAGKSVRVLPVVIGNCELPDMLSDKRFADFRTRYFPGLRELVRTIQKSHPSDSPSVGESSDGAGEYGAFLEACSALEEALETQEPIRVNDWLKTRTKLLAALVANPRDMVLPAPALSGLDVAQTYVCWTSATQYVWNLVKLGPLAPAQVNPDSLCRNATDLVSLTHAYTVRMREFLQACMLKTDARGLSVVLEESYPESVSRSEAEGQELPRKTASTALDRLILLAGRRAQYTDELIVTRNLVKQELGVHVKSYEWLLESLSGKLYQRTRR